MSKPEQILIIEPQNELKFRGPFNTSVTSHMRLTNPTEKKVLFKIKTTAPKKYCVRPNSGILDPRCTVEVAICLQPFIYDPNEKNKHKFMVQTLIAPDGDFDMDRLWKDVTPEQLMDSKLKCVFELPVDNNTVIDLSSSKIHEKGAEVLAVKQDVGHVSASAPPDEADKRRDTEEKRSYERAYESLSSDKSKSDQDEEKLLLKLENEKLRQIVDKYKSLVGPLEKVRESFASGGGGGGAAGGAGASAEFYRNPYAPPATIHQQIPMIYVAAAVAMALLGIILGKFVF